MKRIDNLSYEDISCGKVFVYLDEGNAEIEEFLKYEDILKENSGFYLITGEATLADGTKYPAIFGISSDDGGEMFEFHFLLNKEQWVSNNKNLPKLLNKKRNQIFPFTYHLDVKVSNDLHTDNQY